MFTDIVGYTALVDEDEKKALDLFAALVAPSNFIRRASCAAKAVGAVKAATVFGITLY